MMMNYKELLTHNKIQKHNTSKNEVESLLKLAMRDMQDAEIPGLSADRAFAIAYNAALQLCTIILAVEGYRTKGTAHHKTTFEFVEMARINELSSYAVYFNKCRNKRNDVDYDRTLVVSIKEKNELIQHVKSFYTLVDKWLAKQKI